MPKDLKTAMSDDEVLDVISADLTATVDYIDELSDLREEDMNLYRGQPYKGDDARKANGWSVTVSKVIANTVNWVQPALVEIFSGDFYRFNFTNSEFATDLKKLVDKIWMRQQNGDTTNDDFINDSLNVRTGGVMKTYHYEEYDLETEEFESMTEEQFMALQEDPDLTISRFERKEETVVIGEDPLTLSAITQTEVVYEDVKVVRKETVFNNPKIECVQPETFGISSDWKGGSLKKARLVYQWSVKNVDFVRRMERAGLFRPGSTDKIMNVGSDETYEGVVLATDQERENRFYVEGTEAPIEATVSGTLNSNNKRLSPANDFKMYEIYTKLDIDGDGFLEPVIITTSGNIIFSIQENTYGAPPFVIGRPFRVPHQYQQQTYAEMLKDEQKTMTNLNRMQQDAAAKSTYANPITNDRQTYDQLRKRTPNSVIFGNPDKIGELPQPGSTQFILKSIEMFQGDIENISGVTRYNQGLDANSLNKTFGGMQLIMTASQKRQRLIARRLGWAFRDVIYNIVKILELYPTDDFKNLLKEHAVVAGSITIDDIIVDVGVSFEERFAISQQLEKLAAWHAQLGVPQQLTTPEEMMNTVRKSYTIIDINTEGMFPNEEQFKQRQKAKAVGGSPAGGGLPAPGEQQSVETGDQQLV